MVPNTLVYVASVGVELGSLGAVCNWAMCTLFLRDLLRLFI